MLRLLEDFTEMSPSERDALTAKDKIKAQHRSCHVQWGLWSSPPGCHIPLAATTQHCQQHKCLPHPTPLLMGGCRTPRKSLLAPTDDHRALRNKSLLLINPSRSSYECCYSQYNTSPSPGAGSPSISTPSYSPVLQQLPIFSATFLTSAAVRREVISPLFHCLISHCRSSYKTQRLHFNILVQ